MNGLDCGSELCSDCVNVRLPVEFSVQGNPQHSDGGDESFREAWDVDCCLEIVLFWASCEVDEFVLVWVEFCSMSLGPNLALFMPLSSLVVCAVVWPIAIKEVVYESEGEGGIFVRLFN